MKIVSATDLHISKEANFDYFKAFYGFALKKNPDAIFLLGDIGDSGLETEDNCRAYFRVFSKIQPIMEALIEERISDFKNQKELPPDEAKELSNLESTTGILYKRLETYRYFAERLKKAYTGIHGLYQKYEGLNEVYIEMFDYAQRNLNTVYNKIKKEVKNSGVPTFTLLGNHDLSPSYSSLKALDMHKRSKSLKNFKLSGYGSAVIAGTGEPVFGGCPYELTTPFIEYITETRTLEGVKKTIISESRDFLLEEKPDIALLHNPILNHFDRSEQVQGRHTGSPGLAQYASKGLTKLFITGHIHEDSGMTVLQTENGAFSVVVNPGCLGNTEVKGGNFVEIEMDDNTKEFVAAKFYRIHLIGEELEISQVSYVFRKGNHLEQMITDNVEINTKYSQLKAQNPITILDASGRIIK